MRADVYEGEINGDDQIVVVISGDERNKRWPHVLAAPIISRLSGVFAELPTAIELGDAEPVQGRVLLDLLEVVAIDNLTRVQRLGTLTEGALTDIDAALPLVFGLDPGAWS